MTDMTTRRFPGANGQLYWEPEEQQAVHAHEIGLNGPSVIPHESDYKKIRLAACSLRAA